MPAAAPSLKARALRYLAAREHSRLELGRKLAPHAADGDEVEALLDWLEGHNWLSQARFAESLVQRRAARYGASRVLAELQQHGLEREAMDALRGELRASELERARAVWQRKFGRAPADVAERARQVRFLSARGFSQQAVRAALAGAADDDEPA